MKLDLTIPEIPSESNSTSISLSVSRDIERKVKNTKALGEYEKRLFNDLHRQAVIQILEMFETGAVYNRAS